MDKKEQEERKASRKEAEKIISEVSAQIANETNKSLQNGSDELATGIEMFLHKTDRLQNVGFEQAKGNAFEYIENMKLMRNIANDGKALPKTQPITDLPKAYGGQGGHTDPADFRISRIGERTQLVQAKFHNNPRNTVKDMMNPKYKGMKFLVPSDKVDATRVVLQEAYQNKEITYSQYKSLLGRLETSGLHDHKTGISSGGTTTEEIYALKGRNGKISFSKAEAYAKKIDQEQFYRELNGQVISGAIGGGLASAIIATTTNLFDVYRDEKELEQALKDIGIATAKGTVAGAIRGAIATLLRRKGASMIPPLKSGNVAVAIASAIMECGEAAYAYAKGEITKEELAEAVGMTVVRTTATYYFTEAIASSGIASSFGVAGATGLFLPMAAFAAMQHTAMSFLQVCNASMLKAEEHRRVAELYEESIRSMNSYRQTVNKVLDNYTRHRQYVMIEFLDIVDSNMLDENNYARAIVASVCFAKQLNMDLKYANFEEFKAAMNADKDIEWDTP